MQATLTELARDTRKIVRPVIHSGKEVILTDRGRPVAKIIQGVFKNDQAQAGAAAIP